MTTYIDLNFAWLWLGACGLVLLGFGIAAMMTQGKIADLVDENHRLKEALRAKERQWARAL